MSTQPRISGKTLYDMIMSQIEPDLTSGSIPTLEMKHATETQKQKRARYDRYEKAFADFDFVAEQFVADFAGYVGSFKKQAMRSAEHKERAVEERHLQGLESHILSI